jgi:hypothetical protein
MADRLRTTVKPFEGFAGACVDLNKYYFFEKPSKGWIWLWTVDCGLWTFPTILYLVSITNKSITYEKVYSVIPVFGMGLSCYA